MKGTIKRLTEKRGFGFIEAEGEKDIFFHCSEVIGKKFGSLKAGDLVSFELKKDKKGRPQAIKVEMA